MAFKIVIEMPGPPRGKGAGRAMAVSGGFGQPPSARIYTDERTRKYESQLRFFAKQAMAGRPPIKTACMVLIEARVQVLSKFSKRDRAAALAREIYPTTKPDCNNYSKILDALNGVVWEDDKQIVREVVEKVYAESPSLVVTIYEIERPQPFRLAPLGPLFRGIPVLLSDDKR